MSLTPIQRRALCIASIVRIQVPHKRKTIHAIFVLIHIEKRL